MELQCLSSTSTRPIEHMRRLLAIVLIFPAVVFAQNTDPRIKPQSHAGVKSVQLTVTKIYTATVKTYDTVGPPGIPIVRTHREKQLIYDTTVTEFSRYDREGNLVYNECVSWDSIATEYIYDSDSSWTATSSFHTRTYDNSAMTVFHWNNASRYDTVAVIGNSAVMKYCGSTFTRIEIFNGDSSRSRYTYANGSTEKWSGRTTSRSDSFWDYYSSEYYASKLITHSEAEDTVKYLDNHGRCLIKVINHFDSAGRVESSEYYNYSVNRFAVQRMWTMPFFTKTYFLPINRSGSPSCEVFRKYDERGLLVQEQIVNNQRDNFSIIRSYKYVLYD
jgi:hypothetical protein